MGIRQWLFPTRTNAQADWVSLAGEELTRTGEADGMHWWRFPDGDEVNVSFVGKQPPFPRGGSAASFQDVYALVLRTGGATLVDFEIGQVAGLPAITSIAKTPRQPHGMTYVGTIALPFAKCGYVVKVQCEEKGITGVRETVLADRRLADGSIEIDPKGGIVFPADWNPDAAEYDEQFPDHPVSRVRRHLRSLARAIQVDERLREEPPFRLPA